MPSFALFPSACVLLCDDSWTAIRHQIFHHTLHCQSQSSEKFWNAAHWKCVPGMCSWKSAVADMAPLSCIYSLGHVKRMTWCRHFSEKHTPGDFMRIFVKLSRTVVFGCALQVCINVSVSLCVVGAHEFCGCESVYARMGRTVCECVFLCVWVVSVCTVCVCMCACAWVCQHLHACSCVCRMSWQPYGSIPILRYWLSRGDIGKF